MTGAGFQPQKACCVLHGLQGLQGPIAFSESVHPHCMQVITAGSRLMDTVREVAAAGSTHAALAGASQRIWDRMLRNAQHNSMAGWNVFEDEADFSALLASEGVTSRGWMTAAAGKLGGLRLDSSLRKALTTGDQSNQ